jgi:leucine dehydrogenase
MVFGSQNYDAHEQVAFFHDIETGLKAVIAIHSTALGPSAGGCRMWSYANDDQAVTDALRLSRGMSFKNAMAGLSFGGGKSVIIGDSRRDKSEALLRAFARAVDSLGGRYITAEDVGISENDIEILAGETKFVSGRKQVGAAAGGNPAPKTAFGVFQGMRAAIELKLGRKDFQGLTVAVQGVGQVGYHLCRLLQKEGVQLVVADVNADSVARAVQEFGARSLPVDEILFAKADIVAPCALGAILTKDSVARMQTTIVAGAANNQLENDAVGEDLMNRGILYAPDYVVNAGGIINVAMEYTGGHDEKDAWTKIAHIYDTTRMVLERAMKEERAPSAVADEMAKRLIADVRKAKVGSGAGASAGKR